MNKDIGSRVSWRTTFAVAAVAFASVFTAWGQEVTYVYTDLINLGTAEWADWTAASGTTVDYDKAIVTFLDSEGGVAGSIDTLVQGGTTLVNYNAAELTGGWWSSDNVESYYVQVYSSGSAIGKSDTKTLDWKAITQNRINIFTQGTTTYAVRTINLGSTYAVPEPTSGLLLLLGVAGLALKRRRQVA